MWFLMAVLSAVFAAATSILAKCGIKNTDSDIATAIRTGFVLVFAWIMVGIKGAFGQLADIDFHSFFFIILSGMATGASWLCYYKALAIGDVNRVVALDKSSTILTILLAMICFQETNHLLFKLVSTVLIGVGIWLMLEKKQQMPTQKSNRWMIYGMLSAIFAALTSILAKVGIQQVDSTLATSIRTIVVLIMAWVLVFIKHKQQQVKNTPRQELVFLLFSAIATGMSWLCYYYALANGMVSVVVPIDKLSIALVVLFSYLIWHEKPSKKAMVGLFCMIVGTILISLAG